LDRANSLSHIAGLQRSVSDYVRSNFWITASGMLNPALLHHALSATSMDRLIFSTDYPFQQPTGQDITAFLGNFKSDEEHEMFTSATAAALFGIELTPAG
jgi:predicted TIM-barrel fold metal-dependent hydrolase